MKNTVKRAVLVYQAGIANVFSVTSFNMADYGRDARRLIQSDFRTCESFSRGLIAAGVEVTSAHCNYAGDITVQVWSTNVSDAPFFGSMIPVYSDNMAVRS